MNTVLLVDDDEDLVYAMNFSLEQNQYSVIRASNGTEAITRAHESHPDVIILDIMMPSLDGLTVCRRLRCLEKTENIPIIMLTARGDVETVKAAFRAGANDYMVKPFDMVKLMEKIEEQLETKKTSGCVQNQPEGR